MGRNLRKMVLSVALATVIAGCFSLPVGAKSEDVLKTSATSVLRIGLIEYIDSLNPFVAINEASHFFHSLVYDNLVGIGEDLEITPNLATSSWIVPVDYDSDPELTGMPFGSVWQFNLSTEAYWTNGEQFTADDAVYSLMLYNPDCPCCEYWDYTPYSYYLHNAWRTGNHTVRVSFWNRVTMDPMPAAFADLPRMPMLQKRLIEQLPGGYSYIGMNWTGTFPDSVSPGMPMVGTGPFMVTPSIMSEWTTGTNITLVKNPNCHWTTDYGRQVDFDQVSLEFFQNATLMVEALKEKKLDVAAVPPVVYDSLEDAVKSGTVTNLTCFDGLNMNQHWTEIAFSMAESGPNPSRLDPTIRQALHMVTNKTHIVNNMYLGYADEGTTLVSPVNSYWHYEPSADELFDYDLAAAAALLEANGYIDTDGNGYRDATIGSLAVQMDWVDEGTDLVYQMLVRKEYPEERDIAQYLKTQWEQVGVLLTYLVVEEITLSQIAYTYNYDTLIWYWEAGLDPNDILYPQSRNGWYSWSDNKYYNPAYEENYTNSAESLDDVQRKTFVDNCQRIHYNDSAYIILAYTHATYAWREDTFSGWGNWTAHPGRSLDNIWTGNPLFFDLVANETSTLPGEVDLLEKYWWIAPIAAISVAVIAAFIYVSRTKTS